MIIPDDKIRIYSDLITEDLYLIGNNRDVDYYSLIVLFYEMLNEEKLNNDSLVIAINSSEKINNFENALSKWREFFSLKSFLTS